MIICDWMINNKCRFGRFPVECTLEHLKECIQHRVLWEGELKVYEEYLNLVEKKAECECDDCTRHDRVKNMLKEGRKMKVSIELSAGDLDLIKKYLTECGIEPQNGKKYTKRDIETEIRTEIANNYIFRLKQQQED
jgi:hypothetical protein